jgi:phosphatidylserine/phosphatidylglycerophosphate/cardiolipin synthase-like enzyme
LAPTSAPDPTLPPSPAPAPGVNPPQPPAPVSVKPGEKVVVAPAVHVSVQAPASPTVFLPEISGTDYETYRRPATQGLVKPLLNGRNSNGPGPDIDVAEPLVAIETLVNSLVSGDVVYLSAWFFEPATSLVSIPVVSGASSADWGALFSSKAQAGVVVRILINDFDDIAPGLVKWLKDNSLDPLEILVNAMPETSRDNLKYSVTMHPANYGALKSLFVGAFGSVHVGSHHQKFMVVRKGGRLTAFCGGVDLESRKPPSNWCSASKPRGGPVWHDVHCQLNGPIAYDLEREFVQRWNREVGKSAKNPTIKGWKAYETLAQTTLNPLDDAPDQKTTQVQMIRTVSVDSRSGPFETKRDDHLLAYRNIVNASATLLHFENQYFRDQALADALVARAKASTQLKAIFVVVGSAGDDDGDNKVTKHGNYLQHLFFKKVLDAFGARARVYTMQGRAVHAKFVVGDDRWMIISSANANSRSFRLDSEVGVLIDSADISGAFRKRLWAHDLGKTEAEITATADVLAEWDKVAAANAPLTSKPNDMAGEGILAYDNEKTKGEKSSLVKDEIAYMDWENRPHDMGEGPDRATAA